MDEKKYKLIDKCKKDKKNLEGIAELKRDSERVHKKIYIGHWNDWKTSLWIALKVGNSSFICDSGVIEELADEIKKLKRQLRARIKKR